jgi:hypothetical protein
VTRTRITADEKASLPALGVVIPDYPFKGDKPRHPFTFGSEKFKYRREDLRKQESNGDWTEWFAEQLVRISNEIGRPVPYAFEDTEGRARTLDVGCVKFLLDRKPPEVELGFDSGGYIVSVRPTEALISRLAAVKK